MDSDPIITNDLVAELEQLARYDRQAAVERFKQYMSPTNEDPKPTERRLKRSHNIGKPPVVDDD